MIDGDRVICCPGGKKASVVALDKKTGKTVWTAQSTGDLAGYASPVLAEYQGLRMILTMTPGAVIGVNADNGDLLFRPRAHALLRRERHHADLPRRRSLHQLGLRLGLGAAEAQRGRQEGVGRRVWQSKDLDNHHGGVVLLDGYLYGAAHQRNGGGWVCLDWKTGKKMYAEKGVGKGSLTCADGMLYTFCERAKRQVGLVEATPDGHKSSAGSRSRPAAKGPTWPHPVVCGGRLYLRHGDLLFAYDIRAKQ